MLGLDTYHSWICCCDPILVLSQVKATLQYGDMLHTADMLCSISFDRDDEFFATAGVSRRIKVGYFASLYDIAWRGTKLSLHQQPCRTR